MRLLCSFIFLIPFSLQSQHPFQYDSLKAVFNSDIYLAPSTDHIFDNFAEEVLFQLDANSAFSAIDDMIFSIEGSSHNWNHFYFNRHRIDNPLSPGTSLIKPSIQGLSIFLDKTGHSTIFTKTRKSFYTLTMDNGYLGGRLPGSDNIVNKIYGHSSSFERARGPLSYRKRINAQLKLGFSRRIPLPDYNYASLELSLLSGRRNHVSHDYKGMNGIYDETYLDIGLISSMPLFNKSFDMLAGFKRTNHFGAQLGVNKNETSTLQRSYFSVSTNNNDGSSFSWSTGLNLAFQHEELNELNFAKNLADQDGMALRPWRAPGLLSSLFQHLQFNKKIFSNWKLMGEFYNGIIHFNPTENELVHPFYIQTASDDFTPLYIYTFQNQSYLSSILENKLAVDFFTSSSNIDINAKVSIKYNGLLLSQKSLHSIDFDFENRVSVSLSEQFRISVIFSKTTVPFNFSDIKFFSGDYLKGEVYSWDDDGDQLFQSTELGSYLYNSGGHVRTQVNGNPNTHIFRISIPIEYVTNRWKFGLVNTFKSFRNQGWASYTSSPDNLGEYISVNGQQLFYLYPQNDIEYNISEFPTEKMISATGNSSIVFDHPFYASILPYLQFSNKNWFLYASFQAYMAVGISGIGNGLDHNNLGLLSEAQANPNSYINYLGRSDNDRSFVGRLLLSYKPSASFSSVFQIKYKDGRPFNFINSHVFTDKDQLTRAVIWNQGIKGDNPFTGEFNSRTDGLWNFEFRLAFAPEKWAHRLHFQLSFYNILDLGMEISEFSFAPANPDERAPLHLEIPRGMSVTIQYYLD